MATAVWDHKLCVLFNSLGAGNIVTARRYCSKLERLQQASSRRRPGS